MTNEQLWAEEHVGRQLVAVRTGIADNTPSDYPCRREAPNGVAVGQPGFECHEDIRRRSSKL